MTKIYIHDCREGVETLVHSIQIYDQESKRKAEKYIEQEEKIRGHLEIVVVNAGMARVLDRDKGEQIPVPLMTAVRR